MFLESIKFYEHVEVLLKFKFLIFEALLANPALNHDNNIHEYDISRISRHVGYCAFFKKTKEGSTIKFTYIQGRINVARGPWHIFSARPPDLSFRGPALLEAQRF